jgi:tetratricopeptide (TPR) repeat protein
LYVELDEHKKALDDLKKSSKIEPRNQFVAIARSRCYYRQKKYTKALSQANKALAINSNYYIALRRRAKIYHVLKRYDESKDDFTKVFNILVKQKNNRGRKLMLV